MRRPVLAPVNPPQPRASSPLDNSHSQDLLFIQVTMKSIWNRRLFERYQTVFLVLQGYPYQQVSQIIGRSVTTVANYMKAYRRGGLGALNLRHSPGRPRHLTPDQERQTIDVVTHHVPQEVGFPAEMRGTAPLVARYIAKTFQVKFSERGARSLLYRWNFSCTRPTYTLAKADPVKQRQFNRWFRREKRRLRRGEIDRLLFEDESMIRDYPAIGRTGFPRVNKNKSPPMENIGAPNY